MSANLIRILRNPSRSPLLVASLLLPLLGGTIGTSSQSEASLWHGPTLEDVTSAAPSGNPAGAPAKRHALIGIASFYKYDTETASGEKFDPRKMTAAHRTLPFGTRLRVIDIETGKSITVRINDRGPYITGRIVDLSAKAAEQLGITERGLANVKLEVIN